MTGGNDTNQFYLGSRQSGFGSIFDFESTGGTINKRVGFWNDMTNTIDLGVYSVSDGVTPFEPFTFNICVDCLTVIPCTGDTQDCYECFNYTFVSLDNQTMYWTRCDGTQVVSAVTDGQVVNITCARECSIIGNGSLTTGVSCGFTGRNCAGRNSTINVTSAGWIKYTDYFGTEVYENITTTGNYVISGCVICDTISGGTPNTPVATFDSLVCGDNCSPTGESITNLISTIPQNTANNACQQTSPNFIYTNYINESIQNGVVFYSNSQLTVLFNGNSQWFRVVWKGAVGTDNVYSVRINNVGVVIDYQLCSSATPTPTPTITQTPTITSTQSVTNTPTPTQSVTNTPTPTSTEIPTVTPTNTPSPTSIFNYCGFVAVSSGDLLDSTGNSSYPDNTVYVNYKIDGSEYTQSFTVAGTSYICGFYTSSATTSYYYKNDVQTIGSTSVGFYDTQCANAGDCSIDFLGNFSYSNVSCENACTGTTFVGVYTTCNPLSLGCDVFSSSDGILASSGYYSNGTNCYQVSQYTDPKFGSTYSRVINIFGCGET
jgi:hypothetical protein